MAASRSTASELAPAAEPRRGGRVLHDGRTLEVSAAPASRMALDVSFADGVSVADGSVFERMEIDAPRVVQLGRCRFVSRPGEERARAGRIVFLDDLVDCETLVAEGRYVDLRGTFRNLPLVIAQRDRIRPEFRDFCANLAYDLSVYKRFFDEQDQMLAAEPPDVVEAAREVMLRTEGRRFLDFMDAQVAKLQEIVRGYAVEEHERHGFYLRRHLWPYLVESACLRRTNLKPAGYSGDAEVMIMLYENAFRGSSTFAQIMHKYPVETRAAEAVRSRRRVVPRLLRAAAKGSRGRHAFRFLSLACGPAFELDDVFRTAEDLVRFDCSLLDQDTHALELARRSVRTVETALGGTMSVRYHHDSVRTMLRTRDLRARLGSFDFIYSMGLFDYLTSPVARLVLARTFELLVPGGTIVVGNFHATSPTRTYMDYFADWPLTYRTEESFLALAEGLPLASASIDFDDTRCQMFLRLVRSA